MYPDLYYYLIIVFQALLCAFYIGSQRTLSRAAGRELICILIGGLLSVGIIAAELLTGVIGFATLICPAVMLVFSVTSKGGVWAKLLSSAAPLGAGTAICYHIIEHVYFDKGLLFHMKFIHEPELFSGCAVIYELLFVCFMILSGLIVNRKSIGIYNMRTLLALTLSSSAADCLLFYYSVNEVSHIYLLPLHCFFGVLTAALCLHVYNMSLQQSIQGRLENELRLSRLSEHYSRQYIESIKQQYSSVRKMKHDMQNSFLTLTELLRDGEYERAYRFAKENSDELEALQTFADTENSAANAVINSKLSYAAGLGISTRCLSVSDISGISDGELCSLLGNALDNAITACAALPEGAEREIDLDISCENERYYTILVRNTVSGPVLLRDPSLGTTKEDKSAHGLGTKIIRDIARSREGRADFYEEDGMFCCRIALIADKAAACDK